jgi:hypothetical protein
MAVKPAVTKTPARTTTQYTVGNPELKLDVSSAATLPNVGQLTANPEVTTLVGADTAIGYASIAALAAGASANFMIRIPFSGLPTPIVVGVSDVATFIVGVSGLMHTIAGLTIGTFNTAPYAYVGDRILRVTTPNLPVNQTYTGWGAFVSGTMVAVTATAAGTLTVAAFGKIYDILG